MVGDIIIFFCFTDRAKWNKIVLTPYPGTGPMPWLAKYDSAVYSRPVYLNKFKKTQRKISKKKNISPNTYVS